MEIHGILNEILVRLFRDIMDIEEKAIITQEFKDLTNNDMHVIEAIGLDEPKNMTSIARELSVTVGTLTIAMNSLVKKGYENIVCAQPFGCLPCHVCGKGMINKVRRIDPRANIVAVEYDPGATKVNQENRIKLMLSVARENMENRDVRTEIQHA